LISFRVHPKETVRKNGNLNIRKIRLILNSRSAKFQRLFISLQHLSENCCPSIKGYSSKYASITKFGSAISDNFLLKEDSPAPVQIRVIQKKPKITNTLLIPKEDTCGYCNTELYTTALHFFYPILAGKR
jgi:hypothetical protein